MKLGATMNVELTKVLVKLDSIPGKVAYQVKKIKEMIEKEFNSLQKERLKLIELYANKGDDGKVKQGPNGELDFHPENATLINKEYADLQNIDITLPTQIKVTDLPDNHPLTAKDLKTLDDHGILDQAGYIAPEVAPKPADHPAPAVDPTLPLATSPPTAPEAPVTPPTDAPQNTTVDSDVAPEAPEAPVTPPADAPQNTTVDSDTAPAAPAAPAADAPAADAPADASAPAPAADAALGPDPTPASN